MGSVAYAPTTSDRLVSVHLGFHRTGHVLIPGYFFELTGLWDSSSIYTGCRIRLLMICISFITVQLPRDMLIL